MTGVDNSSIERRRNCGVPSDGSTSCLGFTLLVLRFSGPVGVRRDLGYPMSNPWSEYGVFRRNSSHTFNFRTFFTRDTTNMTIIYPIKNLNTFIFSNI